MSEGAADDVHLGPDWWRAANTQHQQVMSGDERGAYGTGYEDWRRYRDA